MKLNDAKICIDCEEVYASDPTKAWPQCPVCGSMIWFPLAVWLQKNRDIATET